eukprot:CAMPEP_0182579528 /NCGR_PEP_ID=MMETSP1324-20130603/44356_1 /TAXON_ID=236786 /ORGANISM="Florenciella sp., Strain RCC1587" /LENGTH=44 /DNA_ID= /DNA_START= /DNA_END= /DNA_ORIENTATION=
MVSFTVALRLLSSPLSLTSPDADDVDEEEEEEAHDDDDDDDDDD